MGLADVILFGIVPGALIFLTQIVWIPFWAAGVINGIGHYWGYRNWSTGDASTNIVPWGILIGGEELHNNHHAFHDIGQAVEQMVRVRYRLDVHPHARSAGAREGQARRAGPAVHRAQAVIPNLQTLQAVITHRYDVMAKYAKSLKRTYAEEIGKLRRTSPQDARDLETVKPWLAFDETMLRESERARLERSLPKAPALHTMVSMRRDLVALWARSAASRESGGSEQ